jgi:hypothetical protein
MAISDISCENYKPLRIEYVYALRCPITFEIFYVGKTQDISYRFKQHLSEATNKTTAVNKAKIAIIRRAMSEGLIPIVSIIDQTEIRTHIDKMHSAHKEIYWMQQYNKIGWELTNKSGIASPIEWSDYSRYLMKVRKREEPPTSWYYFGKDSFGNDIYDRKRMKRDGWSFVVPKPEPIQNNYNPWLNSRFKHKMGINDVVTNTGQDKILVSTVVFPEQPSWTIECARSIPYYEIIEDFDEDEDCDLELDMSDYEPNVDDEPDDYKEDDECANIGEKHWDRSVYINSLTIEKIG